MKPAERAARVAAIDAERKGIGRDIERLSAQRDAFLASRAAAGAGGDSFDAEVLEIVREQAGRNGVSYAPRSAGR